MTPKHQDHGAGQPETRPPEADAGQETASDGVDDVLEDFGVGDAEDQSLAYHRSGIIGAVSGFNVLGMT